MTVKWHPGHYVETGRAHGLQFIRKNDEILKSDAVEGVKLKIYWSELEKGRGRYDFSTIDAVLAELQKHGKNLVLHVLDRTFHDGPRAALPGYIVNNREHWSPLRKAKNGAAASIWKPQVMDRYIELMEAIAKRYDDHPNFQGVTLTETALDSVQRYDKQQYKEQYIRLFEATAKAFDDSIVLANLNYLSGNGRTSEQNLRDIANVVAKYSNGGITTPDSVLSRPTPFTRITKELKGDVLIAPSAQATFIDLKRDSVQAINNLNVNQLGANFLFWAHWHKNDSRYVENRVIPFLERSGHGIQTNPVPDNIDLKGRPNSSPSPSPTPKPLPNPRPLRVEAEDMTLSGEYRIEQNGAASGDKVISLRGGKTEGQGQAQFRFDGLSGEYDIKITYFDENDGRGRIELNQDDREIAGFTLNQQLGSTSANAKTRTHRTISNVSVNQGDVFTLTGYEDGTSKDAEHVRIDAIEFIGKGGPITSVKGGLVGTYYNNKDFTEPVKVRRDNTVDFNWKRGAPTTGVGADTFSVRWTGYVRPEHSERYQFKTYTDDGVRLWVDNKLLINDWEDHAPTAQSGYIDLEAEKLYSLTMEYYENRGSSVSRLSWSSDSQELEVIPQSNLYTPIGYPRLPTLESDSRVTTAF